MRKNPVRPRSADLANSESGGLRGPVRSVVWLWFFGFLFLSLTFLVAALLVWRGGILLRGLGETAVVHASQRNPELLHYEVELDALQGRLAGLMKDSVERKLQILEKSVRNGDFGAEDLKLLEDLKSELTFLRNYAAIGGDLQTLGEHERYRMSPGALENTGREQINQDLVEFKNLVYLGVAAFGISALMLGGAWLHGGSRWKLPPPPRAERKALLTRSSLEDGTES